PGATEGLPTIEEAIFASVPVNVTLLFSREHQSQQPRCFCAASSDASKLGSRPRSVPSLRCSSAVGTLPSLVRHPLCCATRSASPSPRCWRESLYEGGPFSEGSAAPARVADPASL